MSVSTLIAICAAPVLIVLLSALIVRERLTPMTLIALVFALSGTVLLVATHSPSGGGNVSLFGALLAFLSACGYAGFVFCGRLLTSSYHPLQISSVSFGTGALLLLVCASSTRLVLAYPAGGWLMLLYLGCVPTALGYGLFQIGIRSLSATMASIVTMCEPLTAAVLAWILFRHEPHAGRRGLVPVFTRTVGNATILPDETRGTMTDALAILMAAFRSAFSVEPQA